MALGVGVSSIRSDRHAADDSFGLVAMCSIGPILAVLTLGIAFRAADSTYIPPVLPEVADSVELYQKVLLAATALWFLVRSILLIDNAEYSGKHTE